MTKEEVRVHKILHRNPFEDFFLAVAKSNKLPLTQRSYLWQYRELLERHYRRMVLDHLPKDAWKRLDEPEISKISSFAVSLRPSKSTSEENSAR